MLSHIVLIWLPEENKANIVDLEKAANELLPGIPGVLNFVAGKPLPTDRSVVDTTYSLAISMNFRDQNVADSYQIHPLHVEFVNEHLKPLNPRIIVYDF